MAQFFKPWDNPYCGEYVQGGKKRKSKDYTAQFNMDGPEMIKRCLNCDKAECTDCMRYLRERKYDERRGRKSSFDEAKMRRVLAMDCTMRQKCAAMGLSQTTFYRYLKRIKDIDERKGVEK